MPATVPAVFMSSAWLWSARAVSSCALDGIHAGAGGHRLEIQIGRDEHDEVASAAVAEAGGRQPVVLRLGGVDRLEVENRLAEEQPRVEHVEGADDARKRRLQRKAERFEVGLALGLADAAVDVGQQVGQRQPARAARAVHRLFGGEHAEVVGERALQRFIERERYRLGAQRACRHAAPERAGRRRHRHARPLLSGRRRRPRSQHENDSQQREYDTESQ